MGTYDERQPGQDSPVFDTKWVNGVSRAAGYYNNQIAGGSAGDGGKGIASSSGLVDVKNMAEEDLLRGHYVQLGAYLYDYSTDEEPLAKVKAHHLGFEGNLYDPESKGRIAIYISAVKEDKVAKARIVGVCTAIVDVTDITHRFAKTVDGESVFTSSATIGDIEILSDITDTGEQEVAVILGGVAKADRLQAIMLVVVDTVGPATGNRSEIIPNTSGSAQLYNTNPTTGVRTPTEDEPVTIINYHHDTEPYEAGTEIYCRFFGEIEGEDWYELISGDCTPWDEAPPEDP